jgi:hypothetical protein
MGIVLPFLGKAPAIDEETYLWIGRNVAWARPYDWACRWPPWDADGYVFAHPPLFLEWMRLWSPLESTLPLMRAAVGLPWVILLAWAVTRLCNRLCRHPDLAAAAWLASAVVVLGLQDTLMIDLPLAALITASVAAYREGLEPTASPRWFVGAGAALGLALVTKYSAIVMIPVFVAHMTRRGWRPQMLGIALGILAITEAWLWAEYGRVHLWEVWARRAEIASGPFGHRVVGVLARLALLPLPIVIARTNLRASAAGIALALLALGVERPDGLTTGTIVAMVAFAAAGGMTLARGVLATSSSTLRRRHGDRDDPLLLGLWTLAGTAGVALLHNYAASRYLLPIAAPVAIMVTRSAEQVAWGKAILRGSIAVSGVLAAALAVADYRFAAAGVETAALAMREAAEAGVTETTGERRFTGEWSFRWAMERAGWQAWRADEPLASGSWVVVADNASPGAIPADAWEPMRRVESRDLFPVRVVDLEGGIGLYAETLGTLPFGFGRGPIEGATLYRVK